MNYGGINIELETLNLMPYDDIYYLWKRLWNQKEYEKSLNK